MDSKSSHLAGQLRDAIRDNNWPLVEAGAGELDHPTAHGKTERHEEKSTTHHARKASGHLPSTVV